MAKLIQTSESCAPTTCNTVFIDTSLDTHLALFVLCSDTVSDLKNKILHEHSLCFPKIGGIKINAVKVKRRGFFYHLPDSMLITSVFSGVRKSWFISVDASRVEESDKTGGVVDRVHFESDCRPQLLTNRGDLLVPLDEKNLSVVNQRRLDVNGGKDFSKLEMVDHSGDDIGETKSPDACKRSNFPPEEQFNQCGNKTHTGEGKSKPMIQSADIQGNVHGEGAWEIGSGGKRLHKRKRQSEIEEDDLSLEVADASVPESATSELHKETLIPKDVLGDAGGVVSLDMETAIRNTANGQKMVPAFVASDQLNAAKDVINVTTAENEGPGEDIPRENDKFKSNFDNDQYKDLEATLPPKPSAKKKLKTGKEKGYKYSMVEDEASLPESNKGNKKVVTNQSSGKKRKEKKSSDPVNKEAGERTSASGVDLGCMDPASLECIKDASKLEMTSFIGGIRSSEDVLFSDYQKHALDQINKVEDERKTPLDVSSKAMPSEMCQQSGEDERELKSKKVDIDSKLVEVDETLDCGKSSKKRSKSKRTTVSVNQKPVKSGITHAEGSTSDRDTYTASIVATSSTARENRGPDDAILNHLATNKENDRVIQNVLEYVEQIDETQLKSEDMSRKSKIKDKKKRNSDAKYFKELQAKNGNANLNGIDIGVVPSLSDVGGEDSVMMTVESKDFGVDSDAPHCSHRVRNDIVSGPCTVPSKEKCSVPAQEIDTRRSSPDIEMGDMDATMVERLEDGSNQTITSSAKGMRRSKDITLDDYERAGADQIDGVEDETETPFDTASKTMLSEMCQPSDHDEAEVKTKKVTVSSELLVAGKPVDPAKSSKRRKKSRTTAVSESKAPVVAADEPVKTSSSLAEPLKAFDVDPFIGKSNKKESNLLPEDEKSGSEVGAVSSFPLATDKEINDVIQNVVESVKLIDKPQLSVEAMSGKLKKKTKKKQNSDAKNSMELQTKIADNDLKVSSRSTHDREVDSSSKIMRQAKKVDNSTLGCDKDDKVENDSLGTPLNSATIDRSQVPQGKFGDNHDDKCFDDVVSGYASKSRRVSKRSNDLEVSCENNGISFRDYFLSSQEQHGTVDYKVLVEKETNAREAGSGVKTDKIKRKHEKHSHEPSPNLKSSQKLNENDEIRAKPQTGTPDTAEFQQTASDDKHEKVTVEPHKKLSKYTDSGKKASANKQKRNPGAEEAKRSSTFKTSSSTAFINKDKEVQDKSNSVLESSEGTVSQDKKDPVHSSYERFDSVDGRKVSTTHTGGVVDSSKHGKGLIGKPNKPFDDDNHASSADKVRVDDSDASTRTPSDDSVSSDYSDGESSAGSYSSKRENAAGKKTKKSLGYSGMTLDEILKSSSRFKKAKITASQLQMEDDLESQPDEVVPDSQPKI